MFKTPMAGLALAVGTAVAVISPAYAATTYFEDFNNGGFAGAPLSLPPSDESSDRWSQTTYSVINNFNGWTFAANTFYAQQTGTSDGAVLLNEGGGQASTTITGLMSGETYQLSFLQWGDNRPGEAYSGSVSIDGNLVLSYNGVDGAPGTNPGTLRTATFTASGSSALLVFDEASQTQDLPSSRTYRSRRS